MKTKEKIIWNEALYQEYLEKLKQEADSKYRDFNKKTIPTEYEMLGVNVPKCRKIAKEIHKTNLSTFLKLTGKTYYEEVLIESFVIAKIEEEELFFKELERFLPKIDNWAICDGFCNSITLLSKNPEKHFQYFLNLLKEKEPFKIRVGLVTLLSFYVKKEYLTEILNAIDKLKNDHYYVNMAEAWLLAEIYTHYPDTAEEYFKIAKINDFTMNKTISKIRDSYRVTKEAKEYLLKYKRSVKK